MMNSLRFWVLFLLFTDTTLKSQEISCGLGNKEHPCKCLLVRRLKIMQERDKCSIILDKSRRKECMEKVPECHDVEVIDREHNPKNMPVECKRYCSTAKCVCCNS